MGLMDQNTGSMPQKEKKGEFSGFLFVTGTMANGSAGLRPAAIINLSLELVQ